MNRVLLTFFIALIFFQAKGQRFDLGESLTPNTSRFALLGVSSQTDVATYRYSGTITDKLFGRQIGSIIIGVKQGKVVTTVYNLIPLPEDVGVPRSVVNTVQKTLPYPLAFKDGVYGINIDKESISLSRLNNAMTFNRDRIMYYSSFKASILRN